MRLLAFRIRFTEYLRRDTNEGTDSEAAGKRINEKTMQVVVADDHGQTLIAARHFIENYGGHRSDPAFEIINMVMDPVPVTAILPSPTFRI